VLGVRHGQRSRVQRMTPQTKFRFEFRRWTPVFDNLQKVGLVESVQFIANDAVPDVCKVDPNLVCSSSTRCRQHQRNWIVPPRGMP